MYSARRRRKKSGALGIAPKKPEPDVIIDDKSDISDFDINDNTGGEISGYKS